MDAKILEALEDIEEKCSQIKNWLKYNKKPEGIEVRIEWQEHQTYIHYWDPRNPEPRIVLDREEGTSEAMVIEYACRALNMLTPNSFDTGLDWNSNLDWEKLPEQFQKLEELLTVRRL